MYFECIPRWVGPIYLNFYFTKIFSAKNIFVNSNKCINRSYYGIISKYSAKGYFLLVINGQCKIYKYAKKFHEVFASMPTEILYNWQMVSWQGVSYLAYFRIRTCMSVGLYAQKVGPSLGLLGHLFQIFLIEL